MVSSDQIEFGIAQSDIVSWAFAENEIFADAGPIKKLRAIASLFPESLHVVVRGDGPVQTLADLKGRRISVGQTGSGTLADARIVLDASGLTEQDLLAEYLRSGTAAANLSDGSLEGFFLIGGVPIPAVRALAAITPIRLIPIPDGVLLKMQKHGAYDRSVISADTYPGVGAATSTVGFHAVWVVSADASDDLIFAITKALWSEATQRLLDALGPIGKNVRLDHALDGLSIPLHPGAMRFYRQAGLPVEDGGPPGEPERRETLH